jgi:nicotinamide riboside kinase
MIFVVTGPESSGKSTLAQALADHLNWPMFPELARSYLQARGDKADSDYRYRPSDLLTLVIQQQQLEAALPSDAHCILDTDLLTLLIWWQEKYGPTPAAFQEAWIKQAPRHYLLCEPVRLLRLHRHELNQRQCAFSVCSGLGSTRLDGGLALIHQALDAG